MKQAIKLKSILLSASCLAIVILSSCSNSRVAVRQNNNIAKLHTLWIKKETFHSWTQNDQRMIFRFTFDHKQITLTGWFYNPANESFNQTPAQTLNIGKQSFKFKTNTLYLGNVRLSKGDIADIDKAAQDDATVGYILFVPNLSSNNIEYKIYLSSDKKVDTGEIVIASATNTGKKLDPSPPATFK